MMHGTNSSTRNLGFARNPNLETVVREAATRIFRTVVDVGNNGNRDSNCC